MTRHTTIADIAKHLNISKASVAAALSGHGGNTRVGPEMVRRVQQTAVRMNYRSNAGARAMSRRRFDAIGFCVAKKKVDEYGGPDQIALAVVDAAEKYGLTVLLVGIPPPTTEIPVVPRSLNENCLDGLIIHNTMALSPEFHGAVESSGVPVVYLNDNSPMNAIYFEDAEGARMMTDHLIAQGHRRIAMLSPVTAFPHYSGVARRSGYTQAMTAAGLEPMIWSHPASEWEKIVPGLVRSPDRPEAIFCDGDARALLLQRILYDQRLRVPDDVAVAGVNDEVLAMHSTVPLTTVHIPVAEMAKAAVELLMRRIKVQSSLPSIVFNPELIIRNSTLRRSASSVARA